MHDMHASTTGNDLRNVYIKGHAVWKLMFKQKHTANRLPYLDLKWSTIINKVKKFWKKAALLTSAVCPLHHPLAHATANERAGDCNVKPASCEHCIHWHTFRLNDVYTERAYTSLCVLRVPMQMVQM